MSIGKERGGSIQCHLMLGFHPTARTRTAVNFGKIRPVAAPMRRRLFNWFLAKNRPIARDAMDIRAGECSQIFPNLKSSNAVPPRLLIFRVYHLLPPLPLWRLLSKIISNAKCNFSIHPSARLPSSKRCQR